MVPMYPVLVLQTRSAPQAEVEMAKSSPEHVPGSHAFGCNRL